MYDPNAFGTPKDIAALATKLSEVMGAIGFIEKKGHNTAFNYDFVREADVLDAIRKELAHRKVAFVPYLEESGSFDQSGKNGALHVAVLRYRFTFYDGDTGASIVARVQSEGLDTQDKSSSKALTSAVKSFLLKTFLIPTGDDPDATEPKPAERTRPAAAPRPTAAPAMRTAPTTPPPPAARPPEPVPGNGRPAQSHVDLVAQASKVWQANAKIGQDYARRNELPLAISSWGDQQLLDFIEDVTLAAAGA